MHFYKLDIYVPTKKKVGTALAVGTCGNLNSFISNIYHSFGSVRKHPAVPVLRPPAAPVRAPGRVARHPPVEAAHDSEAVEDVVRVSDVVEQAGLHPLGESGDVRRGG